MMPKEGTRVRIIRWAITPGSPYDDNTQVPPGTEGTVQRAFNDTQLPVKWDNGSNLMILLGEDQFEVIGDGGA